MSTIKPYETAAGKRYRVRYRKPDGSQTDKRGFRTKRDAEIFAATVEVKKATGDYVDPTRARVTIGERAPSWLDAKRTALKESSYLALEIAWRVHVEPRWADVPFSRIVRSDVQDWVSELSRKRGASTVIAAYGVLAGIIDSAVDDKRAARNEARGVELPRKVSKAHIYLTHTQVDALAADMRDVQKRTLVRVLAYTGVRWGEVTGLRVRAVDFQRKRLRVDENAVEVNGHIIVGTPKNHERRTVPYPAFLEAELRAAVAGKRPTDLVFGSSNDTHLRTPDSRDGWFAQARKRCDLPAALTIHDLRHTAASLAVAAGAHVKAVQRMLGHKSAAMTLDTYADLFDEDLDIVAARLDEARAAELG